MIPNKNLPFDSKGEFDYDQMMANINKYSNDPQVDKELDMLVDEDPELKDIMKSITMKGLDENAMKRKNSDQDLEDLINEDNPNYKQQKTIRKSTFKEEAISNQRHNSDDELDSLMEAGKNQIMEKKSNVKQDEPPKVQEGTTSSIQQEKSEEKKVLTTDESSKQNVRASYHEVQKEGKPLQESVKKSGIMVNTVASKDDVTALLDEKAEKYFHNIQFMESVTVIDQEISLMKSYIDLLKVKNLDYEVYEMKADIAKSKFDMITKKINQGLLEMPDYYQLLLKNLQTQQNILERAEKEPTLLNKDFVKGRIQKRIDLINEDLKQLETMMKENLENEENEQKKEENEPKKEEQAIVEPENSNQPEVVKIESPLKKDPPKVEVKKNPNDELYQKIFKSAEEYKNANAYLKENDLPNAADSREKALSLVKALKMLNEGKKVNIDELPEEVTPEYIWGMSKHERAVQFKNILEEYLKKKKEWTDKLDQAKEGFQKLSKQVIAKNKNQIKATLDGLQAKVLFYKTIMEKIGEASNNEWTPPPLLEEVTKEEKILKENTDIPAGKVQVRIGRIITTNLNCYLHCIFVLGTDKKQVKETILKGEKDNDFRYTQLLSFTKAEFNHIGKKYFRLVLMERQGFLCCKKDVVVGELTVKFDRLQTSAEFQGDYSFTQIGNPNVAAGVRIYIEVKTRTAVESEYITKTTKSLEITRVFQPFKGGKIEGLVVPNLNENLFRPQLKKVETKKVEEKEKEKDQDVVNTNKDSKKNNKDSGKAKPRPPSLDIVYTMSDFKPEELENPDVIDNLNTLKVLEFKVEEYQKKMKKIEGRTPPELRRAYVMITSKKATLEQMIGEGALQIEQYITIIKNQIDHDKKLIKYFNDQKEMEKAKLVSQRLGLLLSEMTEAIDLAKKQK